MSWLVDRLRGAWAFVLAALTAPISYILTGPCTTAGCGACPLGGACLILFPLLFGGALLGKGYRRIRGRFDRQGRKDNGQARFIVLDGDDA